MTFQYNLYNIFTIFCKIKQCSHHILHYFLQNSQLAISQLRIAKRLWIIWRDKRIVAENIKS